MSMGNMAEGDGKGKQEVQEERKLTRTVSGSPCRPGRPGTGRPRTRACRVPNPLWAAVSIAHNHGRGRANDSRWAAGVFKCSAVQDRSRLAAAANSSVTAPGSPPTLPPPAYPPHLQRLPGKLPCHPPAAAHTPHSAPPAAAPRCGWRGCGCSNQMGAGQGGGQGIGTGGPAGIVGRQGALSRT